MHPALTKGPLFTTLPLIFYFFYKIPLIFYFFYNLSPIFQFFLQNTPILFPAYGRADVGPNRSRNYSRLYSLHCITWVAR